MADEDDDGFLNFEEYKKLMRLSILAYREDAETPDDIE